jgi:hypothetical protein
MLSRMEKKLFIQEAHYTKLEEHLKTFTQEIDNNRLQIQT